MLLAFLEGQLGMNHSPFTKRFVNSSSFRVDVG
jgi:hypothetical protein